MRETTRRRETRRERANRVEGAREGPRQGSRAGRAGWGVVCALLACAACGGGQGAGAKAPESGAGDTRLAKDRPPVAVVARQGDPRGALAAAVGTSGVAPGRGARGGGGARGPCRGGRGGGGGRGR